MTNRELFTQMMKHNTSLPTEQTSSQVLERSRDRGYAVSSGVRYIAAVFIAAALTAALVAVMKHRDIETTAEISSRTASNAEVTLSLPEKTAPAVSEDTRRKIDALLEDMERTDSYTATLCSCSDTGRNGSKIDKYREGINADMAEIARCFKAAQLEPVSRNEAEPLFFSRGLDSISVSRTSSTGYLGGLMYLYSGGEVWVGFILPDEDNASGAASCYFKAKADDPPLYKNGALQYAEGEWSRNITSYRIREGHGTPLAEKSRTVTVSDAEDRIRITMSLSEEDGSPQVSIDSIELAEGVSITDSSVSLSATTAENDDAGRRYRSGGYTLQDKLITLDSSATNGDDILSVTAVIDFNTGDRDTSSDAPYPYRIEVSFNL